MTKTAKVDTRPLMQRALSAIPEYDQLGKAIEALAEHAKTLAEQAKGDPVAKVRAEVRESVVAGNGVPAVGKRLLEAEARQRAFDAEAELIGRKIGPRRGAGLIGNLIEERGLLIAHESEPAFALLRSELDEILGRTRDVDSTLGDVRDMEAAVRAGADKAAAWATLLSLVDRYDAVRVAQYDLVTHAMGGTEAGPEARRLLEPVGYVANMVDLDPAWQDRLTPPPKLRPGESGLAPGKPVPLSSDQPAEFLTLRESPWPAPTLTRGAGHWPTEDRPAFLRWLVSGAPQPWLPNMTELRTAHAQATRPQPTANGDGDGDSKHEKRFTRRLKRAADNAAYDREIEEHRQRMAAGRD